MKKQSFLRNFFYKVHEGKIQCNYIFFGLFFLTILALNLYHITVIEASSWLTKTFFFLYSLGQILIEMGVLLLLACWLKKKAFKRLYFGFIGAMTLLLFSQVFEFILVRLMDVSFAEAMDIVFGADFNNFIELLYLSDIGITLWIIIFSFIVILPLLGIYLYIFTEKITLKKPLLFKKSIILKPLYLIPIFLLGMDFFVSHQMLNQDYVSYRKALPWNMTFLEENTSVLNLEEPFSMQVDLKTFFQNVEKRPISVEKCPNIYVFITESLREDYLDKTTSPNLCRFKKDNIFAETACSSSNGTHISWFSIFYALQPFYWSYMQNKHLDKGAPPLHLLKKMGYKIHALSSAELRYYDFQTVIFGKNQEVVDEFSHYPHKGNIGADLSDINAFNQLKEKLKKKEGKEGNVFIIFLDSTHFAYSWPKSMEVPFSPVEDLTVNHYLSSDPEKLQIIQNRYRNSIYFIDSLFGDFLSFLKQENLYDDSVIVFTGDHGEEFKEKGKLFHASNLSEMQTHVPLYFKLGSYKNKKPIKIASHVDIFPTILHYLTYSEEINSYFHGESILSHSHKPYAITARYNSCRHSYEFVVDDGRQRLYLRFPNHAIFAANQVKILALENKKEEIKPTLTQAFSSFSDMFCDFFDLSTP